MTSYEELFKDNKSKNLNKEFEFGEPVGRERIWSMTDESYEREYGDKNKQRGGNMDLLDISHQKEMDRQCI